MPMDGSTPQTLRCGREKLKRQALESFGADERQREAGRKTERPPQQAVSRILFPASARVAAGVDEATIIPLAPSSLTGSSGLPGCLGRAAL